MNKYKTIGYLLIILIIPGVFLLSFYLAETTPSPEKIITDCYDEYHNKIIGLECESETIKFPIVRVIGGSFVFAIMLLVGAWLVIIKGGKECSFFLASWTRCC